MHCVSWKYSGFTAERKLTIIYYYYYLSGLDSINGNGNGNANYIAHFLCGYIQMRFTTLCK